MTQDKRISLGYLKVIISNKFCLYAYTDDKLGYAYWKRQSASKEAIIGQCCH